MFLKNKNIVFKIYRLCSFKELYQSVKQFGSSTGPRSVGPDLGSNSLQRFSADDKSHREHGKSSFLVQHIYLLLIIIIWSNHYHVNGFVPKMSSAYCICCFYSRELLDYLWKGSK